VEAFQDRLMEVPVWDGEVSPVGALGAALGLPSVTVVAVIEADWA
jgi:hypothetical protein